MSAGTVSSIELGAIEEVLDMGGGYVLDFSNRTFAMFFADLGVDIEPEELGNSKARRLRAFLRAGSPSEVARVLRGLLEVRGGREGDDTSTAFRRYQATLARLEGISVAMGSPNAHQDVLTLEYVNELAAKADRRLSSGDLDGAITVARTLLEAVLNELEARLTGAVIDHGGDLQRQYRIVAKNLRIDERSDAVDEGFKQIARGLVQIVNGLATIRNKASDGHARQVKPQERHARVAVNASKTVADFLVEVYRANPTKSGHRRDSIEVSP